MKILQRNNKLRNRFMAISTVIGGLTIAISYLGFYSVDKLATSLDTQVLVTKATTSHMQADMMHDGIRADVIAILLASKNGEPLNEYEEGLSDHIKLFKDSIAENQKRDLPPEISAAIKKIIPDLDAYSDEATSLLKIAKTNGYDAAYANYKGFSTKFEALEESQGAVSDLIEKWSEDQIGAGSFSSQAKELLLIMLFASLGLVLVMPLSMRIWLFKPINNIINELNRLVTGDFSSDVEVSKRNDEISVMANALNANINKIREVVSSIKNAASSVNSAASEIASGSNDLSLRTEQQASSLEKTAASLVKITGTVKQNSANAASANELSSSASTIAENGGKVVAEAVNAMGNIEKSSQKISDIISVIDEIAFQTNLLALNAAVEAARAGDAGKGFAVVASEVRALAGRSASASKEIKNLIGESAAQVQTGAELVNKAGDTLKGIVKSVKDVAGIVSEIATASHQQAASIDGINSSVTQMDEVTQQNSALVEENTAAAQSMLEQARTLEKLIGFFKVNSSGADNNDEVKSTVLKHQEPKTATTTKPAYKSTHTPVAKAKSVVKAQPEHTPKSATSTDYGWEQF